MCSLTITDNRLRRVCVSFTFALLMFPSSSLTNYAIERRWFNFCVKLEIRARPRVRFARPWSTVSAGRDRIRINRLCAISDATRLFLSPFERAFDFPSLYPLSLLPHLFSSSYPSAHTWRIYVSSVVARILARESTVIESSFFFPLPLSSLARTPLSLSLRYVYLSRLFCIYGSLLLKFTSPCRTRIERSRFLLAIFVVEKQKDPHWKTKLTECY